MQMQPINPDQGTPTPNMNSLPAQTPNASDQQLQVLGDDGAPEDGGAGLVQELEAHLDSLQNNDKAFLAEHLTPEFVRAIGLINGPEVAQYLSQFADPNKVLVPVPRELAEQYLAQAQGQAAPQPQPQQQGMAPQAAQPAQGGMMNPQATATSNMTPM